MPNHIRNRIVFTDCAPEEREALLTFLAGPEGKRGDVDFNALDPMPESVYRGPLGSAEMARYPGEANWYEWSLAHWGTKWNAWDCACVSENVVEFTTAWNGVPELMARLSAKFPRPTLYYYWADEDLGFNVGGLGLRGGKEIEVVAPEEGSAEALALAREIWGMEPEA